MKENIIGRIQLPGRIKETYFCDDKEDFIKLMFAHIDVMREGVDDFSFIHTSLMVLCHEYLALVLSGEFIPFEMPDEWVDVNRDDFVDLLCAVNERLIDIGIPMKEGDNGKLKVDTDKVLQELKNSIDNDD